MKQNLQLKKIKDEVMACQKCPLYKTRNLPVIGQGDHEANVMFIGEAPGANEDRTGFPFCGRAGEILNRLLVSTNLKREDIYITNILKCRPPANRNPEKKEIEAYSPYLKKQIELIQPKLICTLGNFAATFIFEQYGLSEKIQGIGKIHGLLYKTNELSILPLYHPAVATYNANMFETLIEDFKKIKLNEIKKI